MRILKSFRIEESISSKMENYCKEHGKKYTEFLETAILFYIEHDGEFESVHLENIVALFDKRYGHKIENQIKALQTDINTIKENIEKISVIKDKKRLFK